MGALMTMEDMERMERLLGALMTMEDLERMERLVDVLMTMELMERALGETGAHHGGHGAHEEVSWGPAVQ